MEKIDEPFIRIVEQPARSAVRFRYECEGRSAGPIPGINSSPTCATYPTIQIMNYSGSRAMLVVSCVTVTAPHRQHPHHLVGRVGCHNGICSMIVDNPDHLCTFTHLGIQCAKRNEIGSRLKLRKQLQIDPTGGGFEHVSKTSRSLDLGAIRLCFQVFIEDPDTKKFTRALKPAISDPVYDKKLLPKLIITDISTTSCPMSGGKVMLFCNYIDEEDIEVRFFEVNINGVVVWESSADLKPPVGEVHKRVGISLLAPPYPYPGSQMPVNVCLQLRRPSDQRTSDPLVFTYLPDCSYDNCPLIHYKQISANDRPSSAITQSNHKRGRVKASPPSPTPTQPYDSKRPKVMNVLNGSDSEDIDEEEEAEPKGQQQMIPPYYQTTVNHFFSSQYAAAQNYQKPDLNNNSLTQSHCNSNQSSYSNGSNGGQHGSNDLLMECLKTIDIECLAAMQFTPVPDTHHTYTTAEEWNQSVQQQYNESYNNNNTYNENYAYHTANQQTVEVVSQSDKLSFINL